MNLYAIRRRNTWESREALEKVGARSKEVGDTDEVTEIADTVIVRLDPEAQPAA